MRSVIPHAKRHRAHHALVLVFVLQDVSEHPGANSVTAPTDPVAQQADVERKLRFYGVIQVCGDLCSLGWLYVTLRSHSSL